MTYPSPLTPGFLFFPAAVKNFQFLSITISAQHAVKEHSNPQLTDLFPHRYSPAEIKLIIDYSTNLRKTECSWYVFILTGGIMAFNQR